MPRSHPRTMKSGPVGVEPMHFLKAPEGTATRSSPYESVSLDWWFSILTANGNNLGRPAAWRSTPRDARNNCGAVTQVVHRIARLRARTLQPWFKVRVRKEDLLLDLQKKGERENQVQSFRVGKKAGLHRTIRQRHCNKKAGYYFRHGNPECTVQG